MPVYRPTTRSSASSRRAYPSWRRSGGSAIGPRSTRRRRWSCSACSSRRSLRKMITAVVLAAGAATRFGSPKQAVLLEPVLERLRASSLIDDVLVVLGAHDVDTDAATLRCPQWERGPGASLRCGLTALNEDVEAAV